MLITFTSSPLRRWHESGNVFYWYECRRWAIRAHAEPAVASQNHAVGNCQDCSLCIVVVISQHVRSDHTALLIVSTHPMSALCGFETAS